MMRAASSGASAGPHWSQASSSASFAQVYGIENNDDDDNDCPLCLEEMDLSDVHFKPCPCGYRICRFCWHHIKENLNGLCPACRRAYDEESVEFTPVKPEELKRLQQAKKQKEREKKNPELASRKNLANVRVKQKSQVHVQGLTNRFANEDTIASLKSNEQYGQYGKILKLFLAKRTIMPDNAPPVHPSNQPVHVYINYSSQREASACIAAVDGTLSPDGTRLRAGWGTTKYCSSYLRGQRCQNEICMMAHEPGEEIDPVNGAPGGVTREELSTIKHALKEQETKDMQQRELQRTASGSEQPLSLPAAASWATKPLTPQPSALPASSPFASTSSAAIAPPSVAAIAPTPPLGPRSSATSQRHSKGNSAHHSLPPKPVTSASNEEPNTSLSRRQTNDGSRRNDPVDEPASQQQQQQSSRSRRNADPSPTSAARRSSEAKTSTSAPISGAIATPSVTAAAKSSADNLLTVLSSPHLASDRFSPNDYYYDTDNPLESLGTGSFTFSFDVDLAPETSKAARTKSEPPLFLPEDRNNPAIESLSLGAGSAFRYDSVLGSLDQKSTVEQTNYSGAFDPFAETPDQIAKDGKAAVPKSSRFDFARKGLFGSSDSLHTLGAIATTSSSLENGLPAFNKPQNHSSLLVNLVGSQGGRAGTPGSIGDRHSHSSQGSSPKRGPSILSPPPGLSSAGPFATPSPPPWNTGSASATLSSASRSAFASTSSPPPLSDSLFQDSLAHRLHAGASLPLPPLTSTANQPLPPPSHSSSHQNQLPPGLANLFNNIDSNANRPQSSVLPAGLSGFGKDDAFAQSRQNFGFHRPAGSVFDNGPAFNDPAILRVDMSSASRYGYNAGYQSADQQQQPAFNSFLPQMPQQQPGIPRKSLPTMDPFNLMH